MAHKWAKWLPHPCRIGEPHGFRAGGKIRSGPQVGKVATSPLPYRGAPPLQSGGQNQKWPTSGRNGHLAEWDGPLDAVHRTGFAMGLWSGLRPRRPRDQPSGAPTLVLQYGATSHHQHASKTRKAAHKPHSASSATLGGATGNGRVFWTFETTQCPTPMTLRAPCRLYRTIFRPMSSVTSSNR